MTHPYPADLTPADPVRPPAPYQGGKRNLARRVIDRIGAIPHETYVEPFTGMGGVFLRRPFRARCEVINDVSRDVANLFRILQRHYVPLMDLLRWDLTSRAQFDRLRTTPAESLTDLERAARFLYLQRLAFGGKIVGRNFGVVTGSSARFDVGKLAPMLAEVHERLAPVVIECLPYPALLERYDRPGTLFYCDPPYVGCEGDYGPDVFGVEDHARLAGLLRSLRGTFLLSLNDTPLVRSLYDGCRIEAVSTTYTIGPGSRSAGEVLISP